MAADRVLCSKSSQLQNADKTYTEGTLYVYQTLARFMARGGQKKLELLVTDIKGQKISKNNPSLMLDAGSKGRHVLKFSSQDERDAVVNAITSAQQAAAQPAAPAASATPAAASRGTVATPSSTAAAEQGASQAVQQLTPQQRQELLAVNSKLAEQFKALVIDSKALTEDEFWSSAAVLKVAGIAGRPQSTPRSSKRGLANRLVDLARQHEATGDAKLATLNMSSEDERQLLAENPALRQIYDAQVGSVMTRAEFWQRYFRYHMFKRIKRGRDMRRFKQLQQNLMADSAAAVADMMGGQQQEEMENHELTALFSALEANTSLDDAVRKALKRRLNPVVDLAAAAEDRLTADGYGLAHNAARSELEQVQGYSALSQQLAQEYNVHAAAVMGHVPSAPTGANAPGSSSKSAAASSQPGAEVMSEMSEEELRRFRQQAGGSGLDDLAAPLQQQFEQLQVTNPRLYFSNVQQQQAAQQQQQQPWQAPAVKQEGGSRQQEMQPQDVLLLLHGVNPNDLTDQPMQPQAANAVLHELCGGDVADAARRGGPRSLPQDRLDFMQRQAMVVDELLRHFWSQIPVNTPEKEAKMQRIQQSLDDTYKLLNKTLDECVGPQKAALGRLIKPLRDQLDSAGDAYKAVVKALAAKQQQQRPRPRPQR